MDRKLLYKVKRSILIKKQDTNRYNSSRSRFHFLHLEILKFWLSFDFINNSPKVNLT
jgi:hypothetical protein